MFLILHRTNQVFMLHCQFCSSEFQTKSSLNLHMKTAKYCLEKQGKTKEEVQFICDGCNNRLSSKYTLAAHRDNCLDYLKQENAKLLIVKDAESQQQIEDLNRQLVLKNKEIDRIVSENEEKMTQVRSEYDQQLKAKDKHFQETVVMMSAANRIHSQPQLSAPSVPSTVAEKIDDCIDIKYSVLVELSSLTLNGVCVLARRPDNYVNATQLCKSQGKVFKDWFQLESTQNLCLFVSGDTGIPSPMLLETRRTSRFDTNLEIGTWIHPFLAMQLATWIDPVVGYQVDRWICEFMNTNSVKMNMGLIRQYQQVLEDSLLEKKRRLSSQNIDGPVIYILTNTFHEPLRTYCVGKTTNLNKRMHSYERGLPFQLVYYKPCSDEDKLGQAEKMILERLEPYREVSNHDRFVLPMDKTIEFFEQIIEECVDTLENM